MAISDFAGRTILVVEDDYLVALDLFDELRDAGAEVRGPVASVDDAIREIEKSPHLDAALLDVNIRGGRSYRAADLLRQRRIPFVFITGYDAASIDEGFADIPRCEKPADLAKISRVLFGRPPAA
jgi:CheY-like chemotaxis protein